MKFGQGTRFLLGLVAFLGYQMMVDCGVCQNWFDDPNSACRCVKTEQQREPRVVCENVDSPTVLKKYIRELASTGYKVLQVRDSKLDTLPDGLFRHSGLRRIELYNNGIRTVESDAFEGMKNFSLLFHYNGIDDINFVLSLSELAKFEMSREAIEEIPEYAFANKPYLWKVGFLNCPLRRIGHHAFINSDKIQFINIFKNRVPLIRIADYAFDNPGAGNRLEIVLAEASIKDSTFNPRTFIGADVAFLDLDENHLTTLRENVFSVLVADGFNVRNITITGRGNPLRCAQSLKWIVENEEIKKIFQHFTCWNGTNTLDLQKMTPKDLTS